MEKRFSGFVSLWFAIAILGALPALGQIPNQLAEDFVAGTVPSPEDVARFEKEAAASPDSLRLTRKLGKAYFFQFFGEGDADAVPKAEKTLEKALAIGKDDPESMVYLGSLQILRGRRLEKSDASKQKASYAKGFELIQKAERLGPRNGAVLSVASASYLWLPDSYGMAAHVVGMLEGMRKGMGVHFKRFAHHGQQRLLLTLGQAYARTGQPDKARATFDEALLVNANTVEAGLIRGELGKLKQER